jgi:hypothetical protein
MALTRLSLLLPSGISGDDHRPDAASRPELTLDFRRFGFASAHHIFQHPVDDVFLENTEIAVRGQIFLQRLELKAILVGYVANPQGSEIRQPGLRAYLSEFRHVDKNFVVWKLIGPSLDFRELCIQP